MVSKIVERDTVNLTKLKQSEMDEDACEEEGWLTVMLAIKLAMSEMRAI
jgi:hypothetical protein